MTKPVHVDSDAELEILHATGHHEREREGLGLEFLAAVDAAISTLGAPGPECGLVADAPPHLRVRRKLLGRFPYAVVFIEKEAYVRVLAVTHGHGSPGYWLRRL